MVARGGVRGTPHAQLTHVLPGHVPLGARGQEPPEEEPQGVGPGGGRPVDGAAVDPGCHQVHLQPPADQEQQSPVRLPRSVLGCEVWVPYGHTVLLSVGDFLLTVFRVLYTLMG